MSLKDRRVANRRNPINVLKEARALLARPYSWIKGDWWRHNEKSENGYAYCATGALFAVSYTYQARQEAKNFLRAALRELGHGTTYVESFNDRKSTHKRDVIAVFDKAIALAESAEEIKKSYA